MSGWGQITTMSRAHPNVRSLKIRSLKLPVRFRPQAASQQSASLQTFVAARALRR